MDAKAPILMVEDDDNDAIIVKRALKEAGVACPVYLCKDGLAARNYLRGEGPGHDGERRGEEFTLPWLVITDLKMPKLDGLELLKWMRSESGCDFIPTVMLSASAQASDVEEAYNSGVSSYMVKPSNYQDFVEMMKLILNYWSTCEKPHAKLSA